jgi:hypothetical protein
MITHIGSYYPKDYEAITANAVVALTAATYNAAANGAKECRAFITLETNQIRYTLDGTTPSSTVGHLLNPDESLVLENMSQIRGFQAIKVANDASLKVTYFVR